MADQKYCVVAQPRERRSGEKYRVVIAGPFNSKEAAEVEKQKINRQSAWKRTHRYFHVAKFPYYY